MQIAEYEVKIQAALEKSNFAGAINLANECLRLDPKNEKAHIAKFLASKNEKTFGDVVKKYLKVIEQKEYKELLRYLSQETKRLFDNEIAKVKAAKKKKIVIIIAVVLAALIVVGVVLAFYFTSDAFVYGAKGDGSGGIVITDYRGSGGDITIPEKIGGKPVTKIGDGAFFYCRSLTSIVIPNSVTKIGSSAFSWCDSLESIVIPNSVTTIGYYAFSYCSSLKSVVIPNSVTKIESSAFYWCDFLTIYCEAESKPEGWSSSWNYEDRPVVWGFTGTTGSTEDGFKWAETKNGIAISGYAGNATTLEIPSEINGKPVTTIGERAFSWRTSLKSVVIPNSVTTIENWAFYNCDSLVSVVIPDSVTTIGDTAFYDCDSLTIYCEAESKPEGWDSYWNYSGRPVVWGYTGE